MIYKEKYNILSSPNSPNMRCITTVGKGSIHKSLRGLYTSVKEAVKAIEAVLSEDDVKDAKKEDKE